MNSEKNLLPVAIGLPVYNEERHLSETLDSILHQTYPNLTIYISDNCSNDGTAEICKRYSQKDERIRYFRNTGNIGSAANFQKVLELAKGDHYDYFMFARGDAILSSNLIRECVNALENDNHAVLAFATTEWINHDGKIITEKPTGYFNTSGFEVSGRVALVIWSNSNHIYGLTRYRVISKLISAGWWQMIGSGLIMLLELTLHGTFVHVHGERWYRRYKYSGETYQKRLDRYRKNTYRGLKKVDYILPFARLSYYLFLSVIKSDLPVSKKIIIFFIILFNAPLRFIVSRGKEV